MAGVNPYLKAGQLEGPRQKFKLTFLPENKTFEIDPSSAPTSGTGLPHSILDYALALGIDIDHACGGVCACSTCHIVVQEGFSTCNESSEEEDDQLEKAPGITPKSRLACQCIPNGTSSITVEIPNWNRNLVRE